MDSQGYILACNKHGLGNRLKCIATAIWHTRGNPSRVAIQWINQNTRDDATLEQIFCKNFLDKLHANTGKHLVACRTWRLVVPEHLQNFVPPSTVNYWSQQSGTNIDFEYGRIPVIIRNEAVSAFRMITPHPTIQAAAEDFQNRYTNIGLGIHVRIWEPTDKSRGVNREEIAQGIARIRGRLPSSLTIILFCALTNRRTPYG